MPYIGYWQLLNAVDTFVIYDNIEYTKKGWINRNRILVNNNDAYITIPLEKDSDFLSVNQRFISYDFNPQKLQNQIQGAYSKAPFFKNIFPIVKEIINYNEKNLFVYIYNSINIICELLDIKTTIIKSSTIQIDHSLKNKDKVLAICNNLNANMYINPIGGIELYSKNDFLNHEIQLFFLSSKLIHYKQFKNNFVPNLSVIDVLMFNSIDEVKNMLSNFELQ